MLVAAIGGYLPVSMAIALSPFPFAAVVACLGTDDGGARGRAFAVGWLVGLGTLMVLLTFVVGEIRVLSFQPAAWLQILAGLGLLAGAVYKWRSRPRGDDAEAAPGWMAALDRDGPARALGIGAALGGANPKNVVLATAGAASIAERALSFQGSLVAAAIFVLLGSSSVLGAVLAHGSGSPRARRGLDAAKRFMLRNNNVILMGIFALIGLTVLGDGIASLAG